MAFQSIAQQHYLFAKKPEIAEEFAEKTPKSAYNTLPMHKSDLKEDKEMVEEKKEHQREKKHPEEARIHESKGIKNRFHEYNMKHRRKKHDDEE